MSNPKIAEVTPSMMVNNLRTLNAAISERAVMLQGLHNGKRSAIRDAKSAVLWCGFCAFWAMICIASDLLSAPESEKTSWWLYAILGVCFVANWFEHRNCVRMAQFFVRMEGNWRVKLRREEDRFEDEVKFHERFWGDVFQAINDRKVK